VPDAGTPDTIAAHSIAIVDGHGVITVRTPGDGHRLVIDKYEDPICPPCSGFDTSFGHQIRRAIEQGQLTVRYHVAAFLDSHSASGDYSTRAYAAMLAVATAAGDQPGLLMAFHTMLYDSAVQPREDAAADLTDAQLAELARRAGAPDAVLRAITDGAQLPLARSGAARTLRDVQNLIPSHGVPAVLVDGAPVDVSDPQWLTTLLHR
jgi:protein-disulfide isomerase